MKRVIALWTIVMSGCSAAPPAVDEGAQRGVAEVVARDGRQAQAARFEALFPSSETGRAWAAYATLAPSAVRPDVQALAWQQLVVLAQHPREALRDVERGLAGFAPDQSRARQLIVQKVARLPLPLDERVRFLQGELRRPAGDGQAFFEPAIALDALAEILHDGDRLESIVRDAIAEQPKPEARELLAARLRAADAARGERLLTELGAL